MFSFFTKKPAEPTFVDRVWVDDAARLAALLVRIRTHEPLLLVAFFPTTIRHIEAALSAAGVAFAPAGVGLQSWPPSAQVKVILASRLGDLTSIPGDADVWVYAGHPHPEPNRALLKALSVVTARQAVCLAALDDPLFQHYGGARLAELMTRMGLPPGEALSHPMITKSLAAAQEKVGKQAPFPRNADSEREWLAINLLER